MSALREELAFDPFFADGLAAFTFGRSGTTAEQKQGRRHLFDALTAPERTAETRACGVKCAFGHGEQAQHFAEVLREEFPEAKVFHVVRRDQVAQFGSFVKARSTSVFHRTGDAKGNAGKGNTGTSPVLTLDPDNFARYMLDIHEANAYLRRLSETHDVFTVEYESDILQGDLRTNDALFSFVNVEPQEAVWLQHRKVSPAPEMYIANYAALSDLQAEIEGKLNAGHSIAELREEYAPPLSKSLYQTGRHWVKHPGYAAHQIAHGLKKVFGSSQTEPSS